MASFEFDSFYLVVAFLYQRADIRWVEFNVVCPWLQSNKVSAMR
jgi:hypothetical protein